VPELLYRKEHLFIVSEAERDSLPLRQVRTEAQGASLVVIEEDRLGDLAGTVRRSDPIPATEIETVTDLAALWQQQSETAIKQRRDAAELVIVLRRLRQQQHAFIENVGLVVSEAATGPRIPAMRQLNEARERSLRMRQQFARQLAP
jgi:hypothetical protein